MKNEAGFELQESVDEIRAPHPINQKAALCCHERHTCFVIDCLGGQRAPHALAKTRKQIIKIANSTNTPVALTTPVAVNFFGPTAMGGEKKH